MKKSSVQYGDATGSASIDWHDAGGLHKPAEAAGIDIKRYFPTGARFYREGGELGLSKIFGVDTTPIGTYSYEAVRAYLNDNPDANKELEIKGHYDLDLKGYIKRLSVGVNSRGFEHLE